MRSSRASILIVLQQRRTSNRQSDRSRRVGGSSLTIPECLHKKVRTEWGYGRSEQLSSDDLIEEKYRGIRPAFG